MKQIIQNYKTGELTVKDVPSPALRPDAVLVRTNHSLISAGTEKTKVDTAKKSLLGKAKARPDLVKQVLDKAKKDGIKSTLQAVKQRLDSPSPLGYSCSGEVIGVGEGILGLKIGDLVACGGGYANHAEIVCVPRNLVARVPEGVKSEHAAFATVGAIAMQGVRLADARLGTTIAVIGLGLIGLLTVQILKASGCRVIGIDLDDEKLKIGQINGCDQVIHANDGQLETIIGELTGGYGVDSTIITAGTRSNSPVEQAGLITREKGTVVVVGAVGMDLPREPYYMKEINFVISRSYGPGRYDPDYEEKGQDYPLAYVRFTEQRNMESFLYLIEDDRINLEPLITHRFPIEKAQESYSILHGEANETYLGIVLEYSGDVEAIQEQIVLSSKSIPMDRPVIGFIGAGNYATANLLPFLSKSPDVTLGSICTMSGYTAVHVGEKSGFRNAESDPDSVIDNSDAIVIATRHDSHADYTFRALKKGKAVFVEKPLVIKQGELNRFIDLLPELEQINLMVGFNRRFSPAAKWVKSHLDKIDLPRQIMIRVNAGHIPGDHWTQDREFGGGRLVGEGCHFFDLAVFLADSSIKSVHTSVILDKTRPPELWDNFSASLEMENGSIATIIYSSIGDKSFPKEYIEVYCGNSVSVINDFRSMEIWNDGNRKKKKLSKQDKGQSNQIIEWVNGLKSGISPIPVDEIINVHNACLLAIESMKTGTPQSIL